jgi:hypothetical protein
VPLNLSCTAPSELHRSICVVPLNLSSTAQSELHRSIARSTGACVQREMSPSTRQLVHQWAVLALSGVDSKDENNTPVGAKLIRRTFNMEG